MVEAWCNAAKKNASPGAMHKLLQVHTPNGWLYCVLTVVNMSAFSHGACIRLL